MREFDPAALTALVLDENLFERRITLDQLRAMGIGRVVGAGDTGEAWELLHQANPDIVLMEWIGGPEAELHFIRRIRMSEDLPNRAVPVCILTKYGSLANVERARLAGIDGYLRKPISALALEVRLRRVVTHPQPFIVTAAYVGPCRRRRMPDPHYMGPLRRLDDVPRAAPGEEEEIDLKAELLRARVAALELATRRLVAGDPARARAVYSAVLDLVSASEQMDDPCLLQGAREMVRYLQAQGATERLNPDVVRTHVEALQQLAQLPVSLYRERQRVADSLKRMVDKKLLQAAAA
jgi:CheY-like chemotaxis protein